MVQACQFGVYMLGGAEALVHTREIIEGTIRANPDLGICAVVDVDFQNAFPSLFHEAIDSALEATVAELRRWSKRCQDNCGVVFLASGDKHRGRRGAEQGDPLASLQCGCVIADVTAAALDDMRARKDPSCNLACFGFWFADDCEYICRPDDVDLFLECLDRAAAKVRLTRGTGQGVKLAVRLIGDESARFP